MSVIVDNIDRLNIKWVSGFGYNEEYQSYYRVHQIHGEWPVSDAILVYILFRRGADKDLFEAVENELKEHNVGNVECLPIKRIGNWKVRDEFVEMDKQAKAIVNEKNEQIKKYMDALNDLGVDTSSIMYLKHKTPREHREYETDEYEVEHGQYSAYCRKGTWLYDTLMNADIVDLTQPSSERCSIL